MDDEIIPLEVKSGKDYERHNALSKVQSTPNYGIRRAIVLCNDNLHVKGTIGRVFEFSNGVKREDFQKDRILYFAIVKNIEIIGEASYMLSLDFKDAYPDTITPQPSRQSSWFQKRN